MIETLPLLTPQNEFVSDAFEQSTVLARAVARAVATASPCRTQVKQTLGWSGVRRAATVPSLEYATTP